MAVKPVTSEAAMFDRLENVRRKIEDPASFRWIIVRIFVFIVGTLLIHELYAYLFFTVFVNYLKRYAISSTKQLGMEALGKFQHQIVEFLSLKEDQLNVISS